MVRNTPSAGTPPTARRWDLAHLCVTETVYPPLYRMPAHSDGPARVSVLLAGAVEETADGATHLSAPGSVVVKPAGILHDNRFGPAGARVLSVAPEPALLREGNGLTRYRWRHGTPLALPL